MKVKDNQTIFDFATQNCGDPSSAYELAVLNGINITDDIVGLDLILPDVVNSDIVNYFNNKNITPATLLTLQAQVVASVVDTIIRDVQTIQNNLIKVLEGQTLIDLATQYCGSASAAFDLATLNGYSVTDQLEPGTLLQKTDIIDKAITSYYYDKSLTPATGLSSSTNNTRIFDQTFSLIFN